jgi:cytochrome oxidase Cu insertion factor (SCO1/SenC/PrrC family)
MIPMALICIAGYLALTRPVGATNAGVVPIVRAPVDVGSWRQRLVASPSYAFRFVAASAAIGIVLVGGIPMAVAAASPNADPILATAVDGTPNLVNFPAPTFSLVDQHDQPVSLADLRGKTIALTFLDPVCTSDCPIIAQEFRQADQMLGALSKKVEFVAVDANPLYTAPDYLLAFDRQENLSQISNWAYLTGRLSQLESTWNNYGILIGYSSGGAMIAHGDLAYVIGPTGYVRYSLDSDPGAETSATRSSFAVTLVNAITRTADGS